MKKNLLPPKKRYGAFFLLFSFLFCSLLNAQAPPTCSGKWGPPILNQTFGQGNASNNWYSPLATYAPGLSTSTTFVGAAGGSAGGNLANGESGLVKNSGTPNPNQWWANKSDHTGNPNGLMMLIDAPLTPNTVFVEYVIHNLCPNTALRLSIWILNTNAPSTSSTPNYKHPNMTLKVLDPATGAVIGSSTTGNVPADLNWHEYSLIFTNGSNTSVKLQLVNNVSGANIGNDLAIDDITVSPCIPATIQAIPNASTTLCQGQDSSVTFTATLTGNSYTPAEYQWQYSTDSGTTWIDQGNPGPNPVYTFNAAGLPPGNYQVRFRVGPQGFSLNSQCNAISDVATVTITTPPKVNDTILKSCFIESTPHIASFDLTSANVTTETGITKKYYPSLTDATIGTNEIISAPTAYLSPNGLVYVRVTNSNGCFSIAKVTLVVLPPITSSVLKDKIICIEDKTELDAGPGFDGYEWSTGATTQKISNIGVGTYWVKLKTGNCITKQMVKVYPSPNPVITSISISNNTATVNVTGGTPYYQYAVDATTQWQNSNYFTNLTRGQHTFYVKDDYNCAPVAVEITVPNLINVITPNGDGVNDVIDYSALAYKKNLVFEVYDRYGNKLYEAGKVRNFTWDGTASARKIPTGTYWYTISWNENDKKNTSVQYNGWILVKNRD